MAKITEYGRMKRRIKREMQAARNTYAATVIMREVAMKAAAIRAQMIIQQVIDKKMLAAWKKERAGVVLPDGPEEGRLEAALMKPLS